MCIYINYISTDAPNCVKNVRSNRVYIWIDTFTGLVATKRFECLGCQFLLVTDQSKC